MVGSIDDMDRKVKALKLINMGNTTAANKLNIKTRLNK